ncbi:hypothetical protein Mmc1_1677 [Magnetococcus marinus MC-1]|uniref:Uncharacterized protein n=1 Tax=Magnetococcus marinus (strain ATCC BAA-1437 / JCM 17883 / MC-1) TaxID=156889 RepID=A0L893_MAGMM|nr:hypothetical protein [Magnetococcus marinus]ABK44186.1 hypothetical protein Mmc1_1677 [Magnetococcus marinus MC-1]
MGKRLLTFSEWLTTQSRHVEVGIRFLAEKVTRHIESGLSYTLPSGREGSKAWYRYADPENPDRVRFIVDMAVNEYKLYCKQWASHPG